MKRWENSVIQYNNKLMVIVEVIIVKIVLNYYKINKKNAYNFIVELIIILYYEKP